MGKFIKTVSTTVKAIKLLSNPEVVEQLYKELKPNTLVHTSTKFGVNDVYHHKYYMIQVVN